VQEKIPALTNVLGWLEVDLDARLYFAKSLLLLCADRLFALEHDEQSQWRVREWPLTPDLLLSLKDYAGVGTLELQSLTHSMGTWRFTLGRNEQAQVFAEAFAGAQSRYVQILAIVRRGKQSNIATEDQRAAFEGFFGGLKKFA
jgi:ATP-binding cassette subfamily B protein